jgi:GNAT superfamily N-acetyltransferase
LECERPGTNFGDEIAWPAAPPRPPWSTIEGIAAIAAVLAALFGGACALVKYFYARTKPRSPRMLAARKRRIQTRLNELDQALAEAGSTMDDSTPSHGGCDVVVTIGTSRLAETDPSIVSKIESAINRAYSHSMADELMPGQVYRRVSRGDVVHRLGMGDDGLQANRVLHLAWRGDQLVGACSSTFQPPWTPSGCGHWGLLSVLPEAQGTGVASALVRAAELRLASVCDKIQIEYEYTPGHKYSDRLLQWYEGKCGFVCPYGAPRPGMSSQFRKCFKPISGELKAQGRLHQMRMLREHMAQELREVEEEEAGALGENDAGRAADPSELVGKQVIIAGLRSSRKHNGRPGVVLSFDERRERYAVQCTGEDGSKIVLVLKPDNIELADGEDVECSSDGEEGSGEEDEEEKSDGMVSEEESGDESDSMSDGTSGEAGSTSATR